MSSTARCTTLQNSFELEWYAIGLSPTEGAGAEKGGATRTLQLPDAEADQKSVGPALMGCC